MPPHNCYRAVHHPVTTSDNEHLGRGDGLLGARRPVLTAPSRCARASPRAGGQLDLVVAIIACAMPWCANGEQKISRRMARFHRDACARRAAPSPTHADASTAGAIPHLRRRRTRGPAPRAPRRRLKTRRASRSGSARRASWCPALRACSLPPSRGCPRSTKEQVAPRPGPARTRPRAITTETLPPRAGDQVLLPGDHPPVLHPTGTRAQRGGVRAGTRASVRTSRNTDRTSLGDKRPQVLAPSCVGVAITSSMMDVASFRRVAVQRQRPEQRHAGPLPAAPRPRPTRTRRRQLGRRLRAPTPSPHAPPPAVHQRRFVVPPAGEGLLLARTPPRPRSPRSRSRHSRRPDRKSSDERRKSRSSPPIVRRPHRAERRQFP